MHVLVVGISQGIVKTVDMHKHNGWEIIYNLQGHGYNIVADIRYPFEPGTIICKPPNVPHTKVSKDGFVDIYLQPEYFFLSKYADKNNVVIFQDDYAKSFEALVKSAYRAFNEQDTRYRQLVGTLYDAMIQLAHILISRTPPETDVERIKSKLVSSFSNPNFSISELVKDTQYSNDHIRRRFKKATGMTPMDYLTNLRLDFAKKLMKENHILGYSISEIAAMSGYYDSQYFSRIFKKKVGMTPLEYLYKEE